jgi:hypothetical protein
MNEAGPLSASAPVALRAPRRAGAAPPWRALRAVARDTVLESLRGRWWWMVILGALAVAALAGLARSLALTEEHEIALAVAAPLARVLAVLIVVLGSIATVTREQTERTLQLALAAPIGRTAWLLGKYLGLALVAVLTALVLCVPVLAFGPAVAGGACWVATLALELALMAAVSLAIGIVVVQVPPAVCAALALYVFGRDLHVVLLLAIHADAYSDLSAAGVLMQALTTLFPRLDLFARTDWLLGAAPSASTLALVGLQGLLYGALALAAATLDLRRRALG